MRASDACSELKAMVDALVSNPLVSLAVAESVAARLEWGWLCVQYAEIVRGNRRAGTRAEREEGEAEALDLLYSCFHFLPHSRFAPCTCASTHLGFCVSLYLCVCAFMYPCVCLCIHACIHVLSCVHLLSCVRA